MVVTSVVDKVPVSLTFNLKYLGVVPDDFKIIVPGSRTLSRSTLRFALSPSFTAEANSKKYSWS